MKHDDNWGSFTSALVDQSIINAKVEAAVLAERERCAKIAESYFSTDLREIAAAIRSGKVSTGPRTSSDFTR